MQLVVKAPEGRSASVHFYCKQILKDARELEDGTEGSSELQALYQSQGKTGPALSLTMLLFK